MWKIKLCKKKIALKKSNNRTVLTDPELPAYWSNKTISIDHYIDILTHLLSEGVFKSILELSGEWLAEQNCRSKFLCSINDFIKKYLP